MPKCNFLEGTLAILELFPLFINKNSQIFYEKWSMGESFEHLENICRLQLCWLK